MQAKLPTKRVFGLWINRKSAFCLPILSIDVHVQFVLAREFVGAGKVVNTLISVHAAKIMWA